MAHAAFIIFPADQTWRITSPEAMDELRFDREAAPAQIAAAVAAKLRDRGYQGQGALLALPANWCLAAEISLADLPKQDRAAMSFRLEEKLPLAAENFTADFVTHGDRALGACVPSDKTRPLIDALESAGVSIQSVTPAVMLAAQATATAAGNQILLWAEPGGISIITLAQGRPTRWAMVQSDSDELALQVDLAAMDASDFPRLIARELPEEFLATLAQLGYDDIETPAPEMQSILNKSAPGVLSGKLTPWFELRRGTMAIDDPLRVVRKSVNAALAAAILCFALLAAAFFYRSMQYDRLAQASDAQLINDFKTEFPGRAISMNPRRDIESEKNKLRTAGSSALPIEAQESALTVLRQTLGKLPPDAKINIEKMAFNDTSLEIEGRSKGNEEVDILVAAARAAGMDVPPPQMRKLPGGLWNFSVRGSKPTRPGAATAGGLP